MTYSVRLQEVLFGSRTYWSKETTAEKVAEFAARKRPDVSKWHREKALVEQSYIEVTQSCRALDPAQLYDATSTSLVLIGWLAYSFNDLNDALLFKLTFSEVI